MNKEQEITLLYQLIEKHFGSGVLMQFEDLTETDNDQLLNRIETMTTYNSYEAAKIANPEYAIFEYQRNFGTDEEILYLLDKLDVQSRAMKECNPADHCMTVEKFLADGHKFVEGQGDAYIDSKGIVRFIGDEGYSKYACSDVRNIHKAHSAFILRAAALETKEPKRTKEIYEKVEYSHAWEIIKLYEDGVELFKTDSDELQIERINSIALRAQSGYSFYQRIETPIEWWEDANDLLGELANLSLDDDGVLQLTMEKGQVGFGMSRDKWCDFARILLEQGE